MTGSLSRRAVLATLPFAFAAPFSISLESAEPATTSASLDASSDDVSAALMRTICAHCVAYSDVGRLGRKADAAASGLAVSTEDIGALDLAIDVERQLLMSVCGYRARNDAERHDKATYLLGIFDGDEPSSEHVTALLISMKIGALDHSPCNLPPARTA